MIGNDLTTKVGDTLLDYSLNNKFMQNSFSWSALFSSKTIWLNVILTVLAVVTTLQGLATFDKFAPAFVLIGVVGNSILKIYFNTTNIASAPTPVSRP